MTGLLETLEGLVWFVDRTAEHEVRRRSYRRRQGPGGRIAPWDQRRSSSPEVRCQVCGIVVPDQEGQRQGHVRRNHPDREGW